jgi:hypothetical protein
VFCGNNPINFVDPLGLYVSGWHDNITRAAMKDAGWSQSTIDTVAQASVDADFRPGHHDDLAAHGLATEPGMSREGAVRELERFVTEQLSKEDLANLGYALHAVQDANAIGHDFGQPPKWYQWPSHLFFDILPFGRKDAIQASRDVLDRYKEMYGDDCK